MNKKSKVLGMNSTTARSRLVKMILFKLLQDHNLDNCFRCKEKIVDIKDLSIEHKIPWLNSENPIELFFDLDNISFSHLSCNYAEMHDRFKIKKIPGMIWCWRCQQYKQENKFPNCAKTDNSKSCTNCGAELRAEYRNRTGKR